MLSAQILLGLCCCAAGLSTASVGCGCGCVEGERPVRSHSSRPRSMAWTGFRKQDAWKASLPSCAHEALQACKMETLTPLARAPLTGRVAVQRVCVTLVRMSVRMEKGGNFSSEVPTDHGQSVCKSNR